ncbi:transposase [Micromonospora sp. 15K316]|uniref:RNA-guided endonuclease InsQ/TnpB family protein n=1 Tax=Micromonospora sp. 15K316 TaxID=2530376 RepID=UPI00104EA856|nr:RNA-guided endonuclease TnpB family protein [Micromonospora sp. 15K316]TDC37232.1 transposase [Micromonospora sp. 15K316]
MKVNHGYVRRLSLTPRQVAALDSQGHAARTMWNLLHAWWTWGGKNRRPCLKQADEAIRQARKDIPWLADLPAQAAQQVLKTYMRAWKNCWEGRASAPEFKSRFRSRMAVDVPQGRDLSVVRLSRHVGQVRVPKVGLVKFRWSGPIPGVGRESGRVTGARLVKDALGWHIVFRTEVEKPTPAQHQGPAVGVDRGVNVALALSDGNDQIHEDWIRPKEAERLLRLERKVARQKQTRKRGEPCSNRLHRTYDQIAKVRAKVKRRRGDWQHKTTTSIAQRYGIVVVEDLRINNMTRSAKGTVDAPGVNVRQKSGLNRSMLNEAHSRTADLLAYKLVDRGGQLLKVPAAGTSQTCSACGHRDSASRRGVAFVCTSCGWTGHADSNAAVNILNAAGLAVYGRGAETVGSGCEASTSRRAA